MTAMNVKNIMSVTILMCSTLFFMPLKAQNTELELTQKIYEALLGGNCDEAQKHYDAWKKNTGLTDDDIEKSIEKCATPSSDATTNDDKKIVEIPKTKLIMTSNAVSEQVAWEDAEMICRSMRLNGSNAWRLPTKEELEIIYAAKIIEINSKAAHKYVWGDRESDEESVRYPAIDLKTGKLSWASAVSTIACYCVNDKISK